MCLMAKRCESELYDTLIRTETACTNQEQPVIDYENISDADTKNNQVFSDLLVEAFTPLVQMNHETCAIDQNPILQSSFIPTNAQHDAEIVPKAILANEDAFADYKQYDEHSNNDSDPDFEDLLPESDFSCDEKDDSSRTQSDNLDIGDSDHQNRTEATSSKRERGRGRGRGRPRTKPRKDPNETRKVGRPRTRPETQRKREKRNYECKDCEQIFDKLSEYVVGRQSS